MYKHIFFDLDRTLWDFERNTHDTLSELLLKYALHEKGIDEAEKFINTYLVINDELWASYRKGLILKEELRYERFQRSLAVHGINDQKLAEDIGNDYIAMSPFKTNMFEGAVETLEYLCKKYTLHIITNGFEEVQQLKVSNCGIRQYFSEIITSDRAGCKKPDLRIFRYSMEAVGTKADECIMIGDCLEADIGGARAAGMHQVFFNPAGIVHSEETTFEIQGLKELMQIL